MSIFDLRLPESPDDHEKKLAEQDQTSLQAQAKLVGGLFDTEHHPNLLSANMLPLFKASRKAILALDTESAKDVTGLGRWGNGDVEVSLYFAG